MLKLFCDRCSIIIGDQEKYYCIEIGPYQLLERDSRDVALSSLYQEKRVSICAACVDGGLKVSEIYDKEAFKQAQSNNNSLPSPAGASILRVKRP